MLFVSYLSPLPQRFFSLSLLSQSMEKAWLASLSTFAPPPAFATSLAQAKSTHATSHCLATGFKFVLGLGGNDTGSFARLGDYWGVTLSMTLQMWVPAWVFFWALYPPCQQLQRPICTPQQAKASSTSPIYKGPSQPPNSSLRKCIPWFSTRQIMCHNSYKLFRDGTAAVSLSKQETF